MSPPVELGGADIGITGKDILMEVGSDGYYEPLDLKLATCRLMAAAPVEPDHNSQTSSRGKQVCEYR